MSANAVSEKKLREKYLDWCSAQVADSFLRLTPEEVFALAERATRLEGSGPSEASATAAGDVSSAAVALWRQLSSAGGVPSGGGGPATIASYQGVVAQIAELLAQQMKLPKFEEWVLAYETDPERFERDLLGFRVEEGGD